jgi:Erv1 / Alr family
MDFTIGDYSSNDGMMTSISGPAAWHFLHTVSFNYPIRPSPQDKRDYRHFIQNLKCILPCGKCRKNLLKNFKKLPLTTQHMASRDTFSRYVYNLHEVVNTMLCKTSGLSYEAVRDKYEYFRARCSNKDKTKTTKCKWKTGAINNKKTKIKTKTNTNKTRKKRRTGASYLSTARNKNAF